MVRTGNEQGGTIVQVASTEGFKPGQAITIGQGADGEDAIIAAVQGGRYNARIVVSQPLGRAHAVGTPIAGSGVTLSAPLTRAHGDGAPVLAELPTPGAANAYARSARTG